ncbi:MAG: group II intron reverse transcriptase/maturase [Verrucomicrobia subdivision 3 bacterium]|nr:group II intron reverse transcriptase/maturase [Limisphaerales bacterium]
MKKDQTTGPAIVAETALPQQAGKAQDLWWWVQPSVWTERMLTRLEESEPTTVWFRLWDKVISQQNLQAAFWAVWRNDGAPGVDGQTVKQFSAQEEVQLAKLREELRSKSYRRQPARRVWIPKPGTTEKRPLGIPAVRDRTMEAALKHVLEPIFERDFAAHSYGFRPGRGCREAVERVEELLGRGHTWCVDLDFKSYFDTIPHERLKALIQQRIKDGSVLELLGQCLEAGVMEELRGWHPTERGSPQGSVISPLLANLYLNPLDHEMVRNGWETVRYADDLVVLCRTQEEAEQALTYLRQWAEAAALIVHPTKTRVVNAQNEGFDFLGWHFNGGRKWPRKKSQDKLREKLRTLTKRNNGRSLGAIIATANPILRGWHGYFGDSHWTGLKRPDGWLRRRLRAMLRKRQKRTGQGLTLADHLLWPNRWFAEQGLFSLQHGSCTYG